MNASFDITSGFTREELRRWNEGKKIIMDGIKKLKEMILEDDFNGLEEIELVYVASQVYTYIPKWLIDAIKEHINEDDEYIFELLNFCPFTTMNYHDYAEKYLRS
jgi:hypothetical protein